MDAQMRQRLLELVYDLLPDDEAAELRRRIEAEPELAAGYADARRTAELFAEASRHRTAKLELQRPQQPAAAESAGHLAHDRRPRPAVEPGGAGAASGPEKAAEPGKAAPPAPRLAVRLNGVRRQPWARGANWTVGIAAALLMLVSLGAYWYHHEQLAAIAEEHLRMVVAGPSRLVPGVAARYAVETTAVNGEPMSARVELALYSPDGKRLWGHREDSDADGRLAVTLPADRVPASGSRLDVWAVHRDNVEHEQIPLVVDPVQCVTQLSLDKPLYQPGEVVLYRSLTLSRFALAADREVPIRFEIRDPGGAVVPGSQCEGVTDRGVGNGAFAIPEEQAGGEYTLVARALDDSFVECQRKFFVRRYRLPRLKKELEFTRESYTPGEQVVADFQAERAEGGAAAGALLKLLATVDGKTVLEKDTKADDAGAARIEFKLPERIDRGEGQLLVVVDDGGTRETAAKTIPINLGKLEVRFYPEGGDLAAELENRVYFTARNPQGEPVELEGQVVDQDGTPVAPVETSHEGMGLFSFTPLAGSHYRLKIGSPADVDNQPALPPVSREAKVVLTTGTGVFDAGQPLEFNVRASQGDLPLVVSVACRGVAVGQQALVTSAADGGLNPVVVPIEEDAGGVLRITVFDYSASPPRPVAERLVYRRMARRLSVALTDAGERHAPGDQVKLSLRVTNEKGDPVAAALGVAVVDDALLSLAEDDTAAMPTQFLLASEVEKPEDLEEADFYLSDKPEAAGALDLLLGTQGWRRFAEKTIEELRKEGHDTKQIARLAAVGGASSPPALLDNLGEIRSRYEQSLAAYRADRTRLLSTVTTVSFFAALGLMLLVAMLGLLKIVTGSHLWIPAVGATACCLVVGAVLMDPGRLRPGHGEAVAFCPFELTPPAGAAATGRPEDDASTVLDLLDRAKRGGQEGGPVNGPDLLLMPGVWRAEDNVGGLALDGNFAGDPAAYLNRLAGGGLVDGRLIAGLGQHYDAFGADLDIPFRGDADGIVQLEDQDFRRLAELGHKLDAKQFHRELAGYYLKSADELDGWIAQYRFPVREYAHEHRAGPPGVRTDFAETLYWNPLLVAGADGTASIQFDLSDSVTTFRALADAHGEGRIGAGRAQVVSRIPFSLEPKLPLEVSAGDRIDLPLAVANDTGGELPVELALEAGELVKLDGPPRRELKLNGGERRREHFVFNVVGQKGQCQLTFRGTAGPLADAVKRPLRVVPAGFPKSQSFSGQIEGEREIDVKLPEQLVEGSLEVSLNAFPSTLAELQQGVESVLSEPYGCFEQASTANYPNVMSLSYMQQHGVADPQVTRRAREFLKNGYARLTGYECSQKGYEWFGSDPGHEALTAYGLMQFRDMAKVYDVDPQMIRRTADWLMARRDEKSGFQRSSKALDSFGRAPEDITDAYITWALSEAGQEGIGAQVGHVVKLASESDDPYLVALAAAGAINAGREDDGRKLLDKLAAAQQDDGHLTGTRGSITRSGGKSLDAETTALAALAWLKLPAYAAQAEKAVRWLVENRQGSGGFGSTQATILALKALVEHAEASRRTVAAGTLIVKRDDLVIGQHDFGAGQTETIVVDGLEADLEPGVNRLSVTLTGDNRMPYALDVRYSTRKPESDENCPVRLSTRLADRKVAAGKTVALTAELENASDEGQPMTVAILGLPAGLEPRADQLDKLKKAGTIDYYETRSREVICYWRSLAPNRKVSLRLDLVAAVPGSYVGPASRAYLYYTSEQKQWADPLQVEITRE